MANRNTMVATQTDTAFTSTAVSVGASSTALLASNRARIEVTITNDHATQIVYLCLGATATINSGIRLNAAGGSWTSHAYTGQISAIASGAATGVLVSEV